MNGFRNFALIGLGSIGGIILDELLKAKAAGKVDNVVVLSRPESVGKLEAYASRGVTVAPVADFSNVPSVSKALVGIDVVISTIGYTAFNLQIPIAEAAKAQGVRLFVPSEFSSATDGATEGPLAVKAALGKQIQAIMPTTVFFTGGFSDWLWLPELSLDLKSGKVAVGGDGNAEASFTSRREIARYVVYMLTTLSPEETSNKTFRIEAERTSLNVLFKAYEAKHGTTLEVEYIPVDELRARAAKNPHDILPLLQLIWATGAGVVGSPLDIDKYAGWNPSPVIEYI